MIWRLVFLSGYEQIRKCHMRMQALVSTTAAAASVTVKSEDAALAEPFVDFLKNGLSAI